MNGCHANISCGFLLALKLIANKETLLWVYSVQDCQALTIMNHHIVPCLNLGTVAFSRRMRMHMIVLFCLH